jgi:hypothetical protein
MTTWLKALFSETAIRTWLILSACSTVSTFFFQRWSGKPRLISAIALLVGFAWANFKLFQKQQSQISTLQAALDVNQVEKSELKIISRPGSRYLLSPVGDSRNGDFKGGYFEFHLMIQNSGNRNAIVNAYQLDITHPLHHNCGALTPREGETRVQGRNHLQGLDPRHILSKTTLIKVEAHSATDYGTLLFGVPDLSLEQFTKSGMETQGSSENSGHSDAA